LIDIAVLSLDVFISSSDADDFCLIELLNRVFVSMLPFESLTTIVSAAYDTDVSWPSTRSAFKFVTKV